MKIGSTRQKGKANALFSPGFFTTAEPGVVARPRGLTTLAAAANATAAELVDVVRDEWGHITEGVTEQELAETKTYLTGAYPLRFDGNGSIASILVGMQIDGLEPDYIDTRNDRIEAVTLEDIQRVAERIYRPDDLSFVIVGQPEGLGEGG